MGQFGSDPAKVAGEAQGLSAALARWLQTVPNESKGYDALKIKSLITAVRTGDPPGSAPGWDGTAQRYLALQPLHLALKELDPASTDQALESELKGLFKSLQFATGFDSPRRYQPTLPSGDR
jgi:hypothetical protein